ncbi:uncharacterized protein LOC126470715 [Schistocerca serialis cubense]|uniref:uncharacterized protein LOC126470715 n=1 Tax=Schistocerca serialis cubense TaxID=2023355 RepID=UPI00214F22F1|nr:uncharacterized protein LOC126470715 [Schistocerca serialis cubense]
MEGLDHTFSRWSNVSSEQVEGGIEINRYVNGFKEAISGPDSKYWKNAIGELEAYEDNKTWKIVPTTNSQSVIDSKWVFKVLFDPDVIQYDSLRFFMAIVAYNDPEMVEFDVHTAFLYGSLEEVYMVIPEGVVVKTEKPVVCELEKSLGDVILLSLFVDDGFIASKSVEAIHKVVTSLKEAFQITVGEGHCFVGVEIERDRVGKIMLKCQHQYMKRIIEKFGMSEAKGLSVPADPDWWQSSAGDIVAQKRNLCFSNHPFMCINEDDKIFMTLKELA